MIQANAFFLDNSLSSLNLQKRPIVSHICFSFVGTKSLFSNLIAFEQCHIDSNNDITSYIIFMDNLIDSAEDVRYLHYCGIIEHWLGTDSEVADLFNRLCQEVAFDLQDSYLSELSNKVDHNYNRKWNVMKATLKHKYFNNPWAYFSFIAAVILLLLTLFQSFFTAYAYIKPPSWFSLFHSLFDYFIHLECLYLFTLFSIVSQLNKRIAAFSMFFKPDVKTREDCLSQVMFYLINQQKNVLMHV